jgi:iron complex outermembrane receptor protein
VALFYIDSKDLIKWVPGSGGLWQPVNIAKTQNYGVEVALGYYQKFAEKHRLDFNANYSYTLAEDREKEKQLIYVPFHKATGTLDYGFGPFSAYVQALFTGQAFTTTDHSEWVDSSTVFNIGAQCSLSLKPLVTFGGRIKNVLNVYYENVAYRPMPSRNFQIFLTFNI